MNTAPSAVELFMFRGHKFFVKRDDLIDPLLSGNKYRKLYSLIQSPANRYKNIISYGGTQSNAMLSIAALCHQKGWAFHYTSRPVAAHLKANPTGNLKTALTLGMVLHEVAHDAYDNAILALQSHKSEATLCIAQGAADQLAQHGIQQLAHEIQQWQQAHGMENLHVITPSGTGTTAYYLASALSSNTTVLTAPTVGNKAYLIEQMNRLGDMPEGLYILDSSKKYHFGKLYPEFLSIYQELKHAGIVFDLIYATKMWHTLFQHIDGIEGSMLYVHSGGLMGNDTMLKRYRRKESLANRSLGHS